MLTLNSKSALITGSSRGIGRGIALKLAECGVRRIAVHYHKNRSAAEQTAAAVRDRGAEVTLFQADVMRPDDIARMFAGVKEAFGSLDILVSNAR
ncbi:MAG TPA: SDR family NAD(P)-dependent oxidoreductase, partial [Alphaproteobacteria bacterium]